MLTSIPIQTNHTNTSDGNAPTHSVITRDFKIQEGAFKRLVADKIQALVFEERLN